MASAAARSLIRSAPARLAAGAGAASRPSLRSLPNLRPSIAARFLKSPVEMAFGVESLMPLHSATASALMTSMLTVSRRGSGWLLEAANEDV